MSDLDPDARVLFDAITQVFGQRHRDGLPAVYDELRRVAERQIRARQRGADIGATSLVNEAWLRVEGIEGLQCESRAHFFRLVAQVMRRLLIDRVRHRGRLRRGGGTTPAGGDTVVQQVPGHQSGIDLMALDEALQRLAATEPARAQLVELRFFAGLTMGETAEALGVSLSTAEREWRAARDFLREVLRP
ncbi:MAG: ECF-type sigma factor [Planctomycetota bacterium]